MNAPLSDDATEAGAVAAYLKQHPSFLSDYPELAAQLTVPREQGSVASLAKVIGEGVVSPKQYPTGMPAKGGSDLSDADVQAVAAYVWTLSHK